MAAMDVLDKALETVTKLAPLPSFVFAAGSAVCLFTSDPFLARIGLLEFRNTHRMWIGVVFIVTFFYLVGHTGAVGFKKIAEWRDVRKLEAVRQEHLSELNPHERALLRRFFVTGGEPQLRDISDGIATGLEAKGIIYRAAQIFSMIDGMPYNVQPWAWTKIKETPDLIGSHEEFKRTEELILEERRRSRP